MLTFHQLTYLRMRYGFDVGNRIFDSVLEFYTSCGYTPTRYISAYNFVC